MLDSQPSNRFFFLTTILKFGRPHKRHLLDGGMEKVAKNLPISSSYNKSVAIRLFATCHCQTCYNLLKHLAASL